MHVPSTISAVSAIISSVPTVDNTTLCNAFINNSYGSVAVDATDDSDYEAAMVSDYMVFIPTSTLPGNEVASDILAAGAGGTVTQYRRNYRCEEGKDYKASFIYVANRKSVVLNATLHFVSQEAYIEYLNSLTNEKNYEGFIASGLAMMQDPGTPIITTNEAQSVTISEKDDGVVVKFSGFTIPMMGMETGELELNAVKTVAEDGSITYSAEPTVVGIARGGMLINYTATLKGTQANEEATPVLVLTLSQATVVTTVFGATTEEASAALLSEYAALGINDVVSTGVGVQGIYKLNGTRQQSMQKGINIIKTSEGVKKVYVK